MKLSIKKCAISPAIMQQLGELVQLQSLHTRGCYGGPGKYEDNIPYGALSNLQSLHTLECKEDLPYSERQLACIPMKNLWILKSGDRVVTKTFLTTDPPVQLKELHLNHYYHDYNFLASLLWNYLASVTSLTHLSLSKLLPDHDGPLSLISPFQELQYLHVHITLAPRFANQPMKKLKITLIVNGAKQ